jgi:NADH-quinone oxidoreductase subunit F
VVNGDEGEPGTFKDRYIMRYDPHLLLEGIAIAAQATGVETAYIYIRGEFYREYNILWEAIREAEKAGYLGDNFLDSGKKMKICVHRGAGAYICGEETGLLSSIEGKPGKPKLKPPFPAIKGLFGCPTVINNVETLSNVPSIIANGAEWYRNLGMNGKCGTRLFCISGHVNKPGVVELPMGYNLKDVIYEVAGGVRDNKKIKGVIPGGCSAPVLYPDEIDIPHDFDSLAKAGSMAGSAGVIVMDEDTDIVEVAHKIAHFYAHESCGQCSQCREGTGWLSKLVEKIYRGEATVDEVDLLEDVTTNMMQQTVCVLSDAAAMSIGAMVKKFREDFRAKCQ